MATSRSGCEGCTDITCASTKKVLSQDIAKNVKTAYDRIESRGMSACLFGSGGTCCRNCNMGPCQIIDGVEEMVGICGATADTVAARNFARIVAAGSASHTDHAREMVKGFIATAKGEGPHEIKDVSKLMSLAQVFDIATEGREINEIALELGEKALSEFGKQDDAPLSMLKRAPEKRQAIWKKLNIFPRGVDREVVDAYIKDAGDGFDLDAIPQDRHGVRHSIIGRVERVGGTARIRCRDTGTEVHLQVPRTESGTEQAGDPGRPTGHDGDAQGEAPHGQEH